MGLFDGLVRRHPDYRALASAKAGLEEELARLKQERDRLTEAAEANGTWVPVRSFHSPIPSPEEIRSREAELFGKLPKELAGIELYADEQLALLKELRKFAADVPYKEKPDGALRFGTDNPDFGPADAAILHCMLRKLRPRKAVAVGSGWSTLALLDSNDHSFGKALAVTVVDPDAAFLRERMRKEDVEKVRLIDKPVHAAPAEVFSTLTSGDVVIADTSHVLKTGNDVHHLLGSVLPRLKQGVVVTVSSVFYPFEYPQTWAYEGRAFNEA